MGVFLAVPAKRQMINIEKLPYPTGIAAATTLRSIHTEGKEAGRQARTLYIAGLLGAVVTWMRDADATWLKLNPIAWMPKWSLFKNWASPSWAPWLRYPKI